MENEKKTPGRPGPTPGPKTVRTTVMVEPDLVEWGKQQPGGLSDLIRRLLREAKSGRRPSGKAAA